MTMTNVLCVDPRRCRLWEGHERLEEHINEDSCRTEIDSFLSHGQRIPALARPLKDDTTHDFELIYGARRLFVARHLNVPLQLVCRNLTDPEAAVAVDIENRQRRDVSAYERGRSYSVWLRKKLFASQEELACTLKVSASQVSRLIRVAQLPPVLVNAFTSPLDICESWGLSLMEIWDNPVRRQALTSMARAIAKEPVPRSAALVFTRLNSASAETKSAIRLAHHDLHDEVVKDEAGRPLFRVRQQRNATAFLLPKNAVSPPMLAQIMREVTSILHHARLKAIDFTQQSSIERRVHAQAGKSPDAVVIAEA
jgi:ParB/RepB/Spo0J family partition protein